MRISILCVLLLAAAPAAAFEVEQQLLDQSGANLVDPNATPNALGALGTLQGGTLNDPDSAFGVPSGGQGAANLDATDATKPFGGQDDFWSRFSFEAHGPDSVSNKYGRFGNAHSPDGGDNPYGAGNPYAPNSPTNPYFRNGSIFAGQ